MIALIIAATVIATPGTSASTATKPAPALPAVAVVFHIGAPASGSSALAAADVALRAPEELGIPLLALRSHPGARISIAVDPDYLAALNKSVTGNTALSALIQSLNPPQGRDADALLAVLARHRPLDASLLRTQAGGRYSTLATSARNRLSGDARVTFTRQDFIDFAALDAQMVLSASGISPITAKPAGAPVAIQVLAFADNAILHQLNSAVRSGAVELIATPNGDPVLPLLVDAGGKTTADQNAVIVGARADAEWLAREAVRSVCAAASGQHGCGFYSPFGAYDDATSAVIKNGGASFALFSDRVVHGAGSQGTQAGLAGASAAALHAYALTIEKGETLPTLFWSEAASADLESGDGTDASLGERLVTLAHDAAAGAQDSYPHVFVVRLEADGHWAQRPDALSLINKFIAAIARGRAGRATTPGAFIRAHAPTAPAYGYPPNSESGSFALWMGSPNQASMWKALATARKAAGGDAILARPQVRSQVFAAESGAWYSALAMPAPTHSLTDLVDGFRAVIGGIYRAAGLTPPAIVAPVKLAPAAPVPSAAPSVTALPSPPARV